MMGKRGGTMGLIASLIRAYFKARKFKDVEILVLDIGDKFDRRSYNYAKHIEKRKTNDFWYNQHGQGVV